MVIFARWAMDLHLQVSAGANAGARSNGTRTSKGSVSKGGDQLIC